MRLHTLLLLALLAGASCAQADPLRDALLNGSYELGGRSYTLTDGLYAHPADKVSLTLLTDWVREGDLDGDGRVDLIAPLAMNSATSGIFHYLAAALDSGDGRYGHVTGYLGDRLNVEALEFITAGVTVSLAHFAYLDHLCCPSLHDTRTYAFARGQLLCMASTSLPHGLDEVTIAAESPLGAPFRFIEIGQPKLRNTPPHVNAYPENLRLALGGGGRAGQFVTAEPQLRVFSVAEYRKIMDPAELKAFDEQFALLKSQLAQKKGTPGQTIPCLPAVKETRKLQTAVEAVTFKNGKGCRFLTAAPSSPGVKSTGLVYVFQGLSADEGYLVTFCAPVPLAGGVTLASMTAAEVEKLTPESFTPNLRTLDQWLSTLELPAAKK